MSPSVNVQQKVTISGLGTYSAQHNLEVEAIDTLDVTVPAGPAGKATVAVQPGSSVKFIMIKTDKYDDDDLTFDVAGAGAQPLNGPVLLSGTGPVALLDADATAIEFINNRTEEVAITIVVGRQAVS